MTASGNLYHMLASPDIIQIFLALVQHENGDIAADTIQLLSELTEADAVESFVRIFLIELIVDVYRFVVTHNIKCIFRRRRLVA